MSASYNSICLIGRLTRDPETLFTSSGTQVTKFSLAVDRRMDKRQNTDFVPIVAFGKLAEAVANYCAKGQLVLVDGELNLDRYEKDGHTRTYTKILAQRIQFLERPKKEDNDQNEETEKPEFFSADDPPSDDVPF